MFKDIYCYDEHGYYLGVDIAQRNPLSKEETYLLPPNATEVKPPKTKQGKIAKFEDDKWVTVTDYKDATVYDANGRPYSNKEHYLEEGYTDKIPFAITQQEALSKLLVGYNQRLKSISVKLNGKEVILSDNHNTEVTTKVLALGFVPSGVTLNTKDNALITNPTLDDVKKLVATNMEEEAKLYAKYSAIKDKLSKATNLETLAAIKIEI